MPSLKSYITHYIVSMRTSEKLLTFKRSVSETKRKLLKQSHSVTLYYCVLDPYSHLIAQIIPKLIEEFNVDISVIVVPPSNNIDNTIHLNYALTDCQQLSQRHQLINMETATVPSSEIIALANGILLNDNIKQSIALLSDVGQAVWKNNIERLTQIIGEITPLTTSQISHKLDANLAKLKRQGHYQSAMLYYGGEWYWSVDRIAWLARRLQSLGLNTNHSSLTNIDDITPSKSLIKETAIPTILDFYFSFRSPYSYIAILRLFELLKEKNIIINIKPLLPMVMRNLSVPLIKKMYILHDSARVARYYNIAFGNICDPLGSGILDCINIFYYAKQQGKSQKFITKTMTGIWSQGLDVNNHQQLKKHVKSIGLDWDKAQQFIHTNNGERLATENLQSLSKLGLWGVPSFHFYKLNIDDKHTPANKIQGHIFWGQDRLDTLVNKINHCL